jgi:imidazolonepropionase-like amidohydrolase
VLFEKVRVFDGQNSALSEPSNVLVRGNNIERISTELIPVDRRADTQIIKGGGRTLMPGLIDGHVHTMMESIPLEAGLNSEISYLALVAGRAAEKQLLRGVTTVRDVGGSSFALKRAIDEGIIIGSRRPVKKVERG